MIKTHHHGISHEVDLGLTPSYSVVGVGVDDAVLMLMSSNLPVGKSGDRIAQDVGRIVEERAGVKITLRFHNEAAIDRWIGYLESIRKNLAPKEQDGEA